MKPKKVRRKPFPRDTKILKKASSKRNLIRGLATLDSIWKRGLSPKDTDKHFLMTWLTYERGNVVWLSKTIGQSRSTLILNLQKLFKSSPFLKLRQISKMILVENSNQPFFSKVYEFYCRFIRKPRLTEKENEGLTNLWLMGVNRKVVRSHFILWSHRQGRTLREICKRWEKNSLPVNRLRAYAAKPGSPVMKWLKPLKLTKTDFSFPKGPKKNKS